MSLQLRLAAILVGAVVAALAAAALVAERAGREVRQEVEQAREAYLLDTLRRAAEGAVASGAALEGANGLQPLIEREKAGTPHVLAIDVFSAAGMLRFSTDRGLVGTAVAPAWVQQLQQPGPWRVDTQSEHVVGARFADGQGRTVGGVALTIAGGPNAAWPAWLRLLGAWALAAAAGALLALLAAALAMRRLLRPHAQVAQVLKEPAGAATNDAHALVAAAGAARQAWDRAGVRVERGLAALREVDDAA